MSAVVEAGQDESDGVFWGDRFKQSIRAIHKLLSCTKCYQEDRNDSDLTQQEKTSLF